MSCFLVTLEADETSSGPRLKVLAFALGEDEAAATAAAVSDLEGQGWSGIEALRTGEVTDPGALPDDFRSAYEAALKWGCGLIIYDEP
jgi:hypothetical protein